MNREDVEKLLGGYGAGILTPEEERALFAAALEDQALFDALAREQPLRALLEDPAARAGLLAALADQPLPWYRAAAVWSMRPRALAAFAGVLCVALPLAVWEVTHRKPDPVLTAQIAPLEAPRPNIVPEPAPPPLVPKARPAAAAKHKPETKPAPPAAEGEGKLGAAGTITGAPETLGQLAQPKASPSAQDSQLPPAAAPRARQVQAMASADALAPVAAPLQWSLMRRQPGGEFIASGAGDLQVGDAVRLRLESKAAGYIYVTDKEKVLASSQVEAGQPFDAAIEPQGPGRRDLVLWFSPYQMVWPATGPARPAFRSGAGVQPGSAVRAGKVGQAPASGDGPAPAQPVSISITLNYR
jgi:hypothetical protein